MSKRRINDQQTHRIHQKQARFHKQAASITNTTLADGLVIARFSRQALIEDSSGHQLRCSIRPEITSLVAGDRVIWQQEDARHGVVVSLHPRLSVLNRPNERGVLKPVAANITQMMITIAPIPLISWSLLDSYLIMAESLQTRACILLNKTDLPCNDIKFRLAQQYEPLGYSILYISKENIEQQQQLVQSLNTQTSVFVGQSGTGKSTIISSLIPEAENIQTGEVAVTTNLGCHTTSNSRLYHLEGGGNLIDSPGIREFGLWDMPAREIADGFREFRTYSLQCQFRNCSHQNTPGCAVVSAVEKGFISQQRYESYINLIEKFMS